MSDVPNLLVAWEGRWHGFASSLRVVFSRSPAGERGSYIASGIALRRPLTSLFVHCALLLAWLSLSSWLFLLFPARIPVLPLRMVAADTVYYFPSAFPETSDVGGARSGTQGRPGGRHSFHPSQTIRIARGPKAVSTIVDAPKLTLPRTRERVANLLAFSGAVPRPPVEAVRRPLRQAGSLNFAPAPVAPASDVTVNAALMGLRAAEAAQFQPAPPQPIPQSQIRNSLHRARRSDAVAAAPEINAVGRVPKLALPTAETVAPVAPPLSRRVSDVSGEWAAAAPPALSPPQAADATAPAGASGSGLGGGGSEPGSTPSHSAAGGGGSSSTGHGSGAGGGDAEGLIVSLNPGDKLGIPPGDASGSLAMSPAGKEGGGLGGSGGGGSIGHGSGPGSGAAGAGPGSGSTGSGPGAAGAVAGISPSPGPGGAGQGNGTTAFVPGVTIQGGVISIPSFGSGPGVPSAVPIPPLGPRRPPAVVVIATSRAGGGMNAYGSLRGSRVYTTYIDTPIGTAVLQYSDPTSHPGFETDLTPPEPLRIQLPPELKSLHVVVKFVMDKVGGLRELRLLEAENSDSAALFLKALQRWQFRPALKANVAIDVEAILGFGINTR